MASLYLESCSASAWAPSSSAACLLLPFGEALRGFAGSVVDVMRSVAWMVNYVFAAVGIVFSVLGYAALIPNSVIAFAALAVAFVLCAHFSRNRLLFLVGIVLLYLTYSVVVVNYAFPLTTTTYTTYRGTVEAGTALSSLLLFLSCVLFFSPSKVDRFGKGSELLGNPTWNSPFVVVLCIVLALILVFGFSRPDAVGGDRGSPSAMYEYSMIFFLLGFYFSGDRRGLRLTLCILLGLFALQNIIYGGRVTALQLLLIFFFACMSKKVSFGQFMALVVFGLLLFTFLGSVRTGLVSAGMDDVGGALSESLSRGFAWDTAYSSWHTSITFMLYGDLIPPSEHLALFWQWVQSLLFGGSVPMSNLAMITQPYFWHQFGGVLPVFFQFYLGPLGVVLIAVYVSAIIRLVNSVCAGLREDTGGVLAPTLRICAVYVSVSCFRWILYSPSQITRGLLLCFLCSVALIWFDRQMMIRSSRRRVVRGMYGGKSPHV